MLKASSTSSFTAIGGRRLARLAATLGVVLAAGGALAGTASAKRETLRFFQVSGGTQFFNAAGRKINLNPPATLPKAGDSFDETNLDYAGTAKAHGHHWTASDHLTCTFTSADTATCNSQIAIGGSLLLSNNFKVKFQQVNAPEPITEGTGVFKGLHGMLLDQDLPKSNDATLVIHLS